MSRGDRERLPGRHTSNGVAATIGGQKLYMHTGLYPDGRVGEIFITAAKQGALVRSLLDALANVSSKALQYGMPLEELCDSLVGRRFDPAGVVQDHDRIKMAASLIDFVGRELAITYLGRADLANDTEVDPSDGPPGPSVDGDGSPSSVPSTPTPDAGGLQAAATASGDVQELEPLAVYRAIHRPES